MAPAWSFPVGSEAFSSGSHDGAFRILWARSLPRDWSVSGNVLFARTTDTSDRYWDNGVTAGLTRAITPALSAFAEWSAALVADRADAHTLDAGVAWVSGPDLQWDVSAGHAFADRGDNWFVSAGLTLRRRARPRYPLRAQRGSEPPPVEIGQPLVRPPETAARTLPPAPNDPQRITTVAQRSATTNRCRASSRFSSSRTAAGRSPRSRGLTAGGPSATIGPATRWCWRRLRSGSRRRAVR